jgi:hypothetical protein
MQSSDHPVALTFPEGDYLKGLICRVTNSYCCGRSPTVPQAGAVGDRPERRT